MSASYIHGEMESTFEIRILLPSDDKIVADYCRGHLEQSEAEPMDVEMRAWVARWRPESLAYYLPQGWSFAALKGENVVGILLAQPMLFFRGLTQTLWIEELVFNDPAIGETLLDTAYKWARDKHLQCVLMESRAERVSLVKNWKYAHETEESLIELRSSRF